MGTLGPLQCEVWYLGGLVLELTLRLMLQYQSAPNEQDGVSSEEYRNCCDTRHHSWSKVSIVTELLSFWLQTSVALRQVGVYSTGHCNKKCLMGICIN